MSSLDELPMGSESLWEGCEIRRDLARRSLDALEVAACRFSGADLTLASLDGCRMRDVVFVDCEASGATFEAVSMSRVEFRRCRLSGAILSRGHLRDVRFVECQMEGVELRVAQGVRLQFDACHLQEADFYGSTLEGARFFDCDLTHVELSHANVDGARLHGSKLERIRGISSLAGATISSAQAVPVALQLLATVGIEVEDEREPGEPSAARLGAPLEG